MSRTHYKPHRTPRDPDLRIEKGGQKNPMKELEEENAADNEEITEILDDDDDEF